MKWAIVGLFIGYGVGKLLTAQPPWAVVDYPTGKPLSYHRTKGDADLAAIDYSESSYVYVAHRKHVEGKL